MMAMDDRILYLDPDAVAAACQHVDVVDAVASALAMHSSGRTVLPDEAYLSWPTGNGVPARSLNMPGFLDGRPAIAGTKIINANPTNPDSGRPRASGLTLLFDTSTARVVCIMAAARISALRTAAVTFLSTSLLGRRPIGRVAVIGAGALASAHLELIEGRVSQLDGVTAIAIHDVRSERASRLRETWSPKFAEHGISVSAVPSAQEAILEAGLIIAVTTTTTGYIERSWVGPGALLVNISLDDPTPEFVLKADRLIVDDWRLIEHDDRRLLGRMYRSGLVVGPGQTPANEHGRAVDAELGQIVAGMSPGRARADEVIIVNPFGLSLEDLAVAARVFEVAVRLGIGTELKA